VASRPQVLIPQVYDQHYWARRTQELGIGVAHAAGAPTADSLTIALDEAMQPNVGRKARAIAAAVRLDGAEAAAGSVVKSARS
jgi:vancomycin aglycone glucosyltransferase